MNNNLKNKTNIELNDLGAGSKKHHSEIRSIAQITKTTAIPAKYGRLLYRLTQWSKSKKILELGTGMGVSTAYFALASGPDSLTYSIEGSASLIPFAKENIKMLKANEKICFYNGNFDTLLAPVLIKMGKADIVLMDGNHKKEASLRYFRQILPYLHNESIVVMDDIRWSEEMLEAWEEIKKYPEVRCSIDLFRMGLLFFKKELLKPQHVSYKY
ncbi:MAG: class I SAM-dependent methyltransferase [Chitinophagales bacterium]